MDNGGVKEDRNGFGTKGGGGGVKDNQTTSLNGVEKTWKEKLTRLAKQNILVICLFISMVIGIVLGISLRELDPPMDSRERMYLKFPGEILMNMLKLIILPLIVSSLISGMTSLDSKASGKIGAAAVVYYLTTTLIAVIIGIILVMTIKPGERGGEPEASNTEERNVEAADTFLDLIRQMFPSNIVQACFSKRLTKLKPRERNLTEAELNRTTSNKTSVTEYDPVLEETGGINMLGLVVFSVAMGIAINKLGEQGRPLKEFIESLCAATMLLVSAVIWYSPIGVLFLVAAQIVSMDDPEKMFEQLSYYFLTVMAGLAVHGFLILPGLFFLIVRRNPYKYMAGLLQAMFTALGTASSSATLPITMRNLQENNHVDPRVISFVAPVGATINMDGTALYEAVAVIFIGQVRGLDLDLGNVITICLTSTAAAIGAAGVPQAGLVTMVLVLTSVGFPTEDVGLILAIDWLLDRFRTMVNVMGDAFGAGIVEKVAAGSLSPLPDQGDPKAITHPDPLQHAGVGGVNNGYAGSRDDLANNEMSKL